MTGSDLDGLLLRVRQAAMQTCSALPPAKLALRARSN